MYAKLVNGIIEYPPINKGNVCNYNLNEELLIQDGYKLLIETEPLNPYCELHYEETDENIIQVWEDRTAQYTASLRQQKLTEATNKAKQAVENGYVTFKNAQFETNAQTVGDLTATMLMLQASGIGTYSWLSKDDKVVELTLDDFSTLGGLIAEFKNNIWQVQYINYKEQIEQAETIDKLEQIEIMY